MSLPPGKTHEDAVERAIELRQQLWSHPRWMRRDEDERIDALNAYCIGLFRGDEEAGRALAQAAIWA